MHFNELVNRDVGVNLRRLQAAVPQHGLNEADVRASLQHVRSTRMAQQVRAAAFCESRVVHVAAHFVSNLVGAHGLAVVGDEQGLGGGG